MSAWDSLMRSRYVEGGRGPEEFDCWGLTRTGRTELFGLPLLPMCADAVPGNIPAITRSVHAVASKHGMHPDVDPAPGMIATGWHGRLCVHVGLVVRLDGLLYILETDKSTGPTCTRMRAFEGRYSKVVYYAD